MELFCRASFPSASQSIAPGRTEEDTEQLGVVVCRLPQSVELCGYCASSLGCGANEKKCGRFKGELIGSFHQFRYFCANPEACNGPQV